AASGRTALRRERPLRYTPASPAGGRRPLSRGRRAMPPSSPLVVNYWYDKRCARAYWTQGDLGPYRELYRHTADWLDPAPGEHWLDLGCGMGRLTRLLWEKG